MAHNKIALSNLATDPNGVVKIKDIVKKEFLILIFMMSFLLFSNIKLTATKIDNNISRIKVEYERM